MKKNIIICFTLLFVAGCYAVPATQDNPFGIDPNELQQWIDTAVAAGQATQVVGTALGNPAVVGIGILIAVVATTIGGSLIKKRIK